MQSLRGLTQKKIVITASARFKHTITQNAFTI